MHEVKVERKKLLAKVKANRAAHHGLFVIAQENFKARVIEEVDMMLEAAKRGEIRLHVGLTAPQDHTADYDRVIEMLEMSVDKVIELDASSFAQMVRNEWAWFGQTQLLNTAYASGSKVGGSH